ncbi:MATE family efflux transporter [Polycladidibacter stylochi]|uniref:MATE family efflux transporter n=1 Tax=Polycladidibacter stylochi TaxID=1807766 RepID=UPI0008351FF0|nr:MATE family efflux transporter [Pseudovibrio stylochi]
MPHTQPGDNPYLTEPLGKLFVSNGLPLVIVMVLNASAILVDAIFLGRFAGAEAIQAVTLVFPLFMFIIAINTLVGAGTGSILARRLGAKDFTGAERIYFHAHALVGVISLILMVSYFASYQDVLLALSEGDQGLADLSSTYITPIVAAVLLPAILTLQSDCLRSEGHVKQMSLLFIISIFSNMAFNYLLIVVMGLGVFGSALGTILAQAVSVCVVVGFRFSKRSKLQLKFYGRAQLWEEWKDIIFLGLPGALSYIGVSLMAAFVLFAIQTHGTAESAATTTAYGIYNRLVTFYFLPLLGFAMAAQSIIGNNVGAKQYHRANQSLRILIVTTTLYSLIMQALFMLAPEALAALFVDDVAVIAETKRIMLLGCGLMVISNISVVISGYFQAIGNATMAGLLGVCKIYFFFLPLVLVVPYISGEAGIWLSLPLSDGLSLIFTFGLLWAMRGKTDLRYGLFFVEEEAVLSPENQEPALAE